MSGQLHGNPSLEVVTGGTSRLVHDSRISQKNRSVEIIGLSCRGNLARDRSVFGAEFKPEPRRVRAPHMLCLLFYVTIC